MFGWIFSPSRLSTSIEFYAHRAQQLAAWLRFAEEVAQIDFVGVPDLVKPAALGAYYWWRRYQPFGHLHRADVCGLKLEFLRDEQGARISVCPPLSEARDTSGLADDQAPELDFGDFQLEFCGVPPELLPQPGEYGHFLVRFAYEALDHATYQPPPGPHPVVVEWEGLTFHAWCEDGWVRVFEESHLHELSGLSAWCEEHAPEEE